MDTKSRVFAYPLRDLREPTAAETFASLLGERIGALPDGERHWQNLVDRQALSGVLSARAYPVTALLLGIIAVVYAIQMLTGATQDLFKLVELGANARGLVRDRALLAEAVLQSSNDNAAVLNKVAWWLAIEPSSASGALLAARDLAERAVEIANGNSTGSELTAYLDTLATTHYRLGDFDKAVEIEREVFSRESNPMHAGQLARFLKARVESDGPYISGNIALPDIGIRKPTSDDEPLIVDIARPIPQGLTLYAYALDSANRIQGLLHLTAPPGHDSGRYPLQPEPATAALLAGSERVQTALVDAGGCRCSQSGIDTTFHAYDEPVYRVLAELSQPYVTAYGREMPLKPGMTLSADVQLSERTLVEWLLEPLYSLKGRL